jgi:hypothetical protein
MRGKLQSLIKEFFDIRLRDTFEDENFVFDCYVPQTYDRVWLVDINPWAPRTDPILFSWMELLEMPDPLDPAEDEDDGLESGFVRFSIDPVKRQEMLDKLGEQDAAAVEAFRNGESEEDSEEDEVDEEYFPELRLVHKNDPEAYNFSTTQYSAHKMPKDVIDASQSGEGLREFARDWEKILAERQRADASDDSEDY